MNASEPIAEHRFILSLTALALIAASLPLSFAGLKPRCVRGSTRRKRCSIRVIPANLLDAMPIAQMLHDPRSTAGK